ncbi:MAG: hypothetical protein ACYDHF_08025 [Candidatus Cryosericum sp.]
MAFEWAYTKAFHQRFKSADDDRVQHAYDSLLYILQHARSDSVAADWLGVSRRTVGRWRDEGLGPNQIRDHYRTIVNTSRKVETRLKKEMVKAGPNAVVEVRPVKFPRPGPTPKAPGAVHYYVDGASLEQIWRLMVWAQAQVYRDGSPRFDAFYFTMWFGSKYQGKFWDGDQITPRPPKGASGAYIHGGQTYNTRLARDCAYLHFLDSPQNGGNNLTLYECLTNQFFTPDTKIIRVVFLERKP